MQTDRPNVSAYTHIRTYYKFVLVCMMYTSLVLYIILKERGGKEEKA